MDQAVLVNKSIVSRIDICFQEVLAVKPQNLAHNCSYVVYGICIAPFA